MPLCQLDDARAGSYMFNCQFDALEQPPLFLIPLFDVSADFLKCLFHFHVELMKPSFFRPKRGSRILSGGVVPKTLPLTDVGSKSPKGVSIDLPQKREDQRLHRQISQPPLFLRQFGFGEGITNDTWQDVSYRAPADLQVRQKRAQTKLARERPDD